MSITDPLGHREIIQRQDEARIQRRVEAGDVFVIEDYFTRSIDSQMAGIMYYLEELFKDERLIVVEEDGVCDGDTDCKVYGVGAEDTLVVDITDYKHSIPYSFKATASVPGAQHDTDGSGEVDCEYTIVLVGGPVRIDERIYCEYEVVDVEVAR